MGSHARAQDIVYPVVLALQIVFFWGVTFVSVVIYFPPACMGL